MNCREVEDYLPAYDDASVGPRAELVGLHLKSCESCRSELQSYRELAAGLESLVGQTVEPPSWLLGTITETVSGRVTKVAVLRARAIALATPKAIAGGAIVAAGLVGAVLLRRRGGKELREAMAEA